MDVGILDILQIFGRAGRPQFDKSGHGIIITSHDKLAHYLSLLTNQFPIESNFVAQLTDNLNAEISLGTVSNMEEAIVWLSYTYLYVRMRKNPQVMMMMLMMKMITIMMMITHRCTGSSTRSSGRTPPWWRRGGPSLTTRPGDSTRRR